jgi:phosphoribosylglycinamide formyltransferase-1
VTARIAVLVSGSGTNLQALLDARGGAYDVVAVGSDRPGIEGLARAERAGVPTFVVPLGDDREAFNDAVLAALRSYEPDLVVLAGYMKILAPRVVEAFPVVNTHPALLPAFPGAHGVRDALAYGVKVTGATVHFATADLDAGPVIAQEAVPVHDDDDEAALHERVKRAERRLLVETVERLAKGGWRIEGRKVVLP